MHIIRERENETQKRVIEFCQDVLNYTYENLSNLNGAIVSEVSPVRTSSEIS